MKLPFTKPKQKQEKPSDGSTEKVSDVFIYDDNDSAWVESLNRRIDKSKAYWDSEYKLTEKSKANEKIYLGSQAEDDEDEDSTYENRVFSDLRTMIPYVTSQITQPVVFPSSNSKSAKSFAEDLEKALFIHADDEQLRQKMKFAVEDAVKKRRGYLKPRYDAVRGNFCAIEYVPAESIIPDHEAKTYEELRYFRHLLKRSVSDLVVMFPQMKEKILETFGFDKNTPQDQLHDEKEINEDWCFVPDEEEGLDLLVTWSYHDLPLGKMRDPNWRYGKSNFLDYHMMPLIEVTVLADGSRHIDKTSYVEQAASLQRNLDRRTSQISKSAGLGNTGMPVVDTAALADDQSQYLSFDEDTVLELDVSSANGQSINDVFTVWQARPLPTFVYTDKLDTRTAIDNTFGTPAILQGEKPSDTLGQDVLLRDSATARLQEVIDAIDSAMDRLYKLMAQFLLVYGNEQELFESNGEDSEFDYVLINTEKLDTFVKIRVKGGTSMPVDRAQKRATAQAAANLGMIDPQSYWEIMDAPNAQKYSERLLKWKLNPMALLKDINDDVFNRDAYVDIELLKNGVTPPFRDDLPTEYYTYLNQYVLSGDLYNPQISPETKASITQFIQTQLQRGQRMLGILQTQTPTQPITANPFSPLSPNVPIGQGATPAPPGQAPLPNQPVQSVQQ